MKRLIAFILLILISLIFISCTITINIPDGQTGAPLITQTSPIYSSSVILTAAPEPYSGPAILAPQGGVIGGYADGQWITPSKAAVYCEQPLTFYEYNLAGYVGTVNTTGVNSTGDDFWQCYSWTAGMGEEYDEGSDFSLLPEETFDSGGYQVKYQDDPLSSVYYYSVPPENLPKITVIYDTSALMPVIQRIIDENLGAGAAQAQIRIAISADIDNDGKEEKIVNADNCADKIYDSEADNLYTIACIIESGGTVSMIREFFVKENVPEFSLTQLSYVQNIIDLDGNGLCEIVLDNSAYEEWWVQVYKYDGNSIMEMLKYGIGL